MRRSRKKVRILTPFPKVEEAAKMFGVSKRKTAYLKGLVDGIRVSAKTKDGDRNSDHNFYCPRCLKKSSAAVPMFIRYSIQRLEFPIFLCGEGRTIYLDKSTIRRIIGAWRKNSAFARKIPFESLYREFMGELEGMVNTYWMPQLGYKRIKFLKRPA